MLVKGTGRVWMDCITPPFKQGFYKSIPWESRTWKEFDSENSLDRACNPYSNGINHQQQIIQESTQFSGRVSNSRAPTSESMTG